jgi:hypothetical protein
VWAGIQPPFVAVVRRKLQVPVHLSERAGSAAANDGEVCAVTAGDIQATPKSHPQPHRYGKLNEKNQYCQEQEREITYVLANVAISTMSQLKTQNRKQTKTTTHKQITNTHS